MQRFFAPGRTELAGNHTDHQLGRVLAASVDVGITARATRRRDRRVCIHSKGYRPFTVALDDLAVNPRAYGKPWALVRGMAAAILDAGGAVGGFEAWASSALKPGGGLSSSAAFEILVGRIFNALYNGGAFSPEQLARFGQQAENRHFGKPSGLMDQLACALDGAVYIDFAAGPGFLARLGEFGNLIVLQTLSKAWGMAGLRLGLAFASEAVAGLFARVKYPYNINSLAQQAVAERLTEDISPQVAEIRAERDRLAPQLAACPAIERVYPSDANFILVRTPDPDRMYDALISAGVIVRNRSRIPGCEGCLRITVGTPAENARMIETVKNFRL